MFCLDERHQGAGAVRGQQPSRVLEADPCHRHRRRLPRPLREVRVGVLGRHRVDDVQDGLEPRPRGDAHRLAPPRDIVPLVGDAALADAVGRHPLQKDPLDGLRRQLEPVAAPDDDPQRRLPDPPRHQPYPLPRVLVQLPHALLDVGARHQLHALEPGPVHALAHRQHHARAHGLRPQALVPVPQRGIDEFDGFHGCSLPRGFIKWRTHRARAIAHVGLQPTDEMGNAGQGRVKSLPL